MEINNINSPTENRPKTFTEVKGQPFVKGLGEKIAKGNLSGQGYILGGPKGCGKTTTARIIAKAVNCKNIDEKTGDPCNNCKTCISIDNNVNPLVKEINSASTRGIQEIKDTVLNTMSYSVPDGQYRVYILDEVHQLTPAAFSLLLKPMEEPPENVLFIATTTNIEKIPDTILSRVPIIKVLPLDDEELKEVLENVISKGIEDGIEEFSHVTDGDITSAILSAQGSARQAITNLSGIIFHGISSSEALEDAHDISDAFRRSDVSGVLSASTKALSNKESDPIVIITAVINDLLNDIKNNITTNPTQTAYQVASLSQVASELKVSSQSQIVAARIASCVHKNIDHIIVNSSSSDVKKKNVNKIMNVRSNSESKIINHILSPSAKKRLSYWAAILDNPDESNIFKEGDALIIEVSEPDAFLKDTLHKMVDKVIVRDIDVFK